MTCPQCYGPTTVLETREKADGSIRRRRRCLDCGHKFTTIEKVQEDKHER